eukprot:403335798
MNQGYTEFFSWGNDEMGQLGHGQEGPDRKKIFNLPKSLSFEVLIQQVSCGSAHTSFISKQGYVFSFGCNSDGQLGVNDPAIKFSSAPLLISDLVSLQTNPVQISCGGFHTAVLTSVGDVYIWGRNLQGQCGRSINYNQFMFAPHKLHTDSANKTFRQVDCGDQHTAVVSSTGELYTFGDNSEGQLGIGVEFKNTVDRAALVTGISEETIQVSCGYKHTLVLTNHGTVFGMGTNKRYELASGTLQKSSQPIRIQTIDMFAVEKIIAGGFSVAITSQNELLVWGSGDFGVFQSPQKIFMEDVRFVDVSLSKSYDSFGAAIDDQGFVYTWGQNQFGQLGQGDFRLRKLPTKIPQLRKKKVRQLVAGGSFIVALGKDIPEGSKQKLQKKPKESKEHEQNCGRSKSQVTFGGNSVGQQSIKRKRNDVDKSQMSTLNDQNKRQLLKSAERNTNHSQEGRPSPLRLKNSIHPYQTPNLRQSEQKPFQNTHELSAERQRRMKIEQELREKEYELLNQKQQQQKSQDLHSQVLMYQRDNEVLREALQKEQENSYRLLSDVHKTLSDMKGIKESLEMKSRENHQLQMDVKRHIEINNDIEHENDRLKQGANHLMQRNDEETHKLKSHVAECELLIDQQRDHIKDLERQLHLKIDSQKLVDNEAEQVRQENQDLRIQVLSLNEKIKSLEYHLDVQQKENDDLKYDNTILYEKNVQKDDKLIQLNDENNLIKDKLEQEQSKVYSIDKDSKHFQNKIKDIEQHLENEKQNWNQKFNQYEDMLRESERQKRDVESQLSLRNIDYDNVKRGFDEQHYELENQRRTFQAKQEEIGSLNNIIQQQSINNNQLVTTIRDLEATIADREEKNKRLVELLNANMYNKAEQYKERVINKLQERTPGQVITPNKTASGSNLNQSLSLNPVDVSEFNRNQVQPSPIRLQKILNDDKDQITKERERLLRLAEEMTKNHDLSKSQGPSQNSNKLGDYQQFRQNLPQFVSPFNNNSDGVSPNKSVHFADQTSYMPQSDQITMNRDLNARLRMSDLSGGVVNMATPHQNYANFRQNESSPDRIAEILKQQSPLRRKLATDIIINRDRSDSTTPNKPSFNQRLNESNFDDSDNNNNLSTGNFTASKITHVSFTFIQ